MTPVKDEYKNADIISVFTTSRVNKKVLEQFPNLKLIALRSVGFNHIDLDYCKEHNIAVETSPNYGNITVAEFALALLLDVCRKVTISYMDYKEGKVRPENLMGMELSGKTIGIVGLGAIGVMTSGVFGAVGGGVLRDVFCHEIPMVLTSDFYASASILGGLLFVLLISCGISGNVLMYSTAIFTIVLRILGYQFKWKLPVARMVGEKKRDR